MRQAEQVAAAHEPARHAAVPIPGRLPCAKDGRVSIVDTYFARIRAKLSLGNKSELTIAAPRYLERPAD